ncbi:MAG: response regulator [Acidobacteriota bacterium]|jgi:DNA-binding response OmpR family regulator|nr:response regulator [Acidobacteriota bacterium]
MKLKILVIDDDAAIRQQLFWTLCDEYEVMTANDLQTAIRRAMVYEPAVSILDLHLPPVLDTPEVGLRILEYIKEHYPNSKVYIVSSESSIETRKACLQNGADGFLSKPLDVEQLLAAVRRSTLAHQLEAI